MKARLFVTAYLPHEVDMPEAVQCNADGDRVIIEIRNESDQTCQVVFSNNEHGDLTVSLRGWGNKPAKLGNMERTSFQATIPTETPNTCDICYGKLGDCGCRQTSLRL